MQKILKRAAIIYFTFLALLSCLFLVLLFVGYNFFISNSTAWFVTNIALEGVLTTACLLKRNSAESSARNLPRFLPLLSLLYICLTGLLVRGASNIFLILHSLFVFLSCYIISLLCGRMRSPKIVDATFNTVMLGLLLFATYVAMTFGQSEPSTVIKQLTSPSETYTAILIDYNPGAVGGSTKVNLEYNTSNIYIIFGHFIRTKQIYVGRWGEFESMTLEWQGDHTLHINGKAYYIH